MVVSLRCDTGTCNLIYLWQIGTEKLRFVTKRCFHTYNIIFLIETFRFWHGGCVGLSSVCGSHSNTLRLETRNLVFVSQRNRSDVLCKIKTFVFESLVSLGQTSKEIKKELVFELCIVLKLARQFSMRRFEGFAP